jgi:hypothetical protein
MGHDTATVTRRRAVTVGWRGTAQGRWPLSNRRQGYRDSASPAARRARARRPAAAQVVKRKHFMSASKIANVKVSRAVCTWMALSLPTSLAFNMRQRTVLPAFGSLLVKPQFPVKISHSRVVSDFRCPIFKRSTDKRRFVRFQTVSTLAPESAISDTAIEVSSYQPKSGFLRVMKERGFLHSCTNIEALDKKMQEGVVTSYLGFDATASSLHVGSLLQIMILRHLQKNGHKPVVLLGGGTTKVGDPTGKDASRKMLSNEDIAKNMNGIKSAFDKFLVFGDGATDAIMVNNDDWLSGLKYLEFLRDYGPMFTINRMLNFESVKLRLQRENPLTFLEFNYMILQVLHSLSHARNLSNPVEYSVASSPRVFCSRFLFAFPFSAVCFHALAQTVEPLTPLLLFPSSCSPLSSCASLHPAQAYDFLELNRRFGCVLQLGGSDQWGNMVNGVELTRRAAGAEVPAHTRAR